MVGDEGHVTGIDMTPAMLAKARAAAAEMAVTNVDFVEGEAERLPFEDSFDVVILMPASPLSAVTVAVTSVFAILPPLRPTVALSAIA